MTGEFSSRNPANSNLEPGEFAGTQVSNETTNSIVSPWPTIHSEAELPQRKGNIIVNHEDLLRRNLVKAGCGRDRTATEVHVGLRLEQKKPAHRATDLSLPLLLPLEEKASSCRQAVQHLKTHVVPCSGILPTGVSQPHYQTGHI